MKAIGATPPRTSGASTGAPRCCSARSGALLGAALGIVLANVLVGFFGACFYGIDAGFHVDGAVLVASLVVGLVGPAARGDAGDPPRVAPAARRGAAGDRLGGRRPGAPRRAACGASASCRAAPRSACAASARRKRRTLATAVQVGARGRHPARRCSRSAGRGDHDRRDYFDDVHFDVWAQTYASKPFDADGARDDQLDPGRARSAAAADQQRPGGGHDGAALGLARPAA